LLVALAEQQAEEPQIPAERLVETEIYSLPVMVAILRWLLVV
jgi:hypothetical protein